MKDFPEHIKENLDKLTRDDLIYLLREYDHTWFCISETLVDQSKRHISDEYAFKEIKNYLSGLNGINPRNNKLELEIKLRKGEITPEEYREIVLGGD